MDSETTRRREPGYETESDSDKEAEEVGVVAGEAGAHSGALASQGTELDGGGAAGSGGGAGADGDGAGAAAAVQVAAELGRAVGRDDWARVCDTGAAAAGAGSEAGTAVEATAYPVGLEGAGAAQAAAEVAGVVRAYPVAQAGDAGRERGGQGGWEQGGLDGWERGGREAVEKVRGQELGLRDAYAAFLDEWRCAPRAAAPARAALPTAPFRTSADDAGW